MKSRDIALVGILLAAGAIARYISLFIPGAIVANLTIAFYCLAIILVVPKFKETLGIGLVAGIICAVFSHSIFPLGNLISEPIGAFVCLLVYKIIKDKTKLAPGITTAIATPASGLSFVAITCLVMIATTDATPATMLSFAISLTPIVLVATIVNSIIVQVIAMPATTVMQKTQPVLKGKHDKPANPETVIGLENVSFTYGAAQGQTGAADNQNSTQPTALDPSIDNVSLQIGKGEFVVVTGPSGSGKTTFCRTVTGIILHSYGGTVSGDITVCGRYADDYKDMEELSLEVGMVFDDADAQLIFTTVEEEIKTGLETRKLSEAEVSEKLNHLYALTNTGEIKDRAPHALSGGQKQRVAFAAALSKETPILVLDEATSELDKNARKQVYSVLKGLADSGKTVVLVEHMVDETVDYATRQIRLEHGKVVYDGKPVKDTAMIPAFERAEFSKDLANEEADSKESNSKDSNSKDSSSRNSSSKKPIASVRNLVHVYGSNNLKALDAVSLDLYAGEIVAVVGENGSGKTTLIKHLNGLLRPTSGAVEIFGKNIDGMRVPEIAENVGLVFQNPDTMLFENTCRKEVEFGLKNIGKNDSAAVSKALFEVGLSNKEDINPRYLSRGERQRLALACVLAMGQPILILDEPTTGLDLQESFEIMELLMKIRNEGKTILMVTHSPKIAEIAADRIIEMAGGKITNIVGEKSKRLTGEIIESTDIELAETENLETDLGAADDIDKTHSDAESEGGV
ncbi:Vitamin B12 import ATP-binding protein BtuD [Methanimicrococcus sp. At1]|uniref:Vitamin B12 import ATP-binding protein BtuD n=1 Tax=Methanimicrococcus hacksteinii TaxID=3028293 RepID=A0ABU3VPP4_9EURY|nr:ATP-binding cassette domain-containing protein [Methanimicrococcus sp. At1]MDV0445373.1 Vitamin B12 import ATP-binding protein BtuD [Methanimicrococcus sp. At1]